jgi:hypothetical protein
MRVQSFFPRLRWLPILVFAVALPAPVGACGFCLSLDGNPLALPHPRAIEIAVATRAAIETGRLNPKCLVPELTIFENGGEMMALSRVPAPLLVTAWARKCSCPKKSQAAWNVHFLFVDTEQSCGLTLRAGAVLFEARPSAHSDARVVTIRITFGALLTGTLSLQEAQKRGLVYLEGDARAASLLPGAE